MPFSDSPTVKFVISAITAMFVVFLVAGCDNDSETPSGPSAAPFSWKQISGPFTTETINDMWGVSSNYVLAVGSGGTIFHYNGNRWDSVASSGGAALHAIWGTHATDIYAVGDSGTVLHHDGLTWSVESVPTNARLHDIHGISTANVVAVGRYGAVLQFDGAEWSCDTVGVYPPNTDIGGVYVAPNGRIFLCGCGGGLAGLHEFDNGVLSLVAEMNFCLSGITGTSDHNIFFYDVDMGMWHYDGTQVVTAGLPYYREVHDVVCLSDTLAYAIQSEHRFWVRRGDQWSLVAEGVRADGCLWMTSEQDIFLGGVAGAIDHFDGTTWSPMINDAVSHRDLYDVWCDPGGEIFVAADSGTIHHYVSGAWSQTNTGVDFPLRGIWGVSPTDVWAIGSYTYGPDYAAGVLHYDGTTWSIDFEPNARDLLSISGNAQGQVFVAGRDDGYHTTVYMHNESGWTTIFEDDGTWSPLGIWSADSALTYLVGGPHAWKYDGQSWYQNTDSGFVSPYQDWFGISGVSRDFVLACGNSGLVGIYNGGPWNCSYEPMGTQFHDIWGLSEEFMVAVGTGIRVFDGSEWSYPGLPNQDSYIWSNPSIPPEFYMRGVSGTSGGDVVAVGDYGTILLYSR